MSNRRDRPRLREPDPTETAPPVYLDHAATTPLEPRVLEAMMPFLTERFGNPGSRGHSRGLSAEAAVDRARQQVADLLGVRAPEVVFTSGATESNNLALSGWAAALDYRCHLVTSAIEHPAVLRTARHLETLGVRLSIVPVNREARVDAGELERVVVDTPGEATLVSVMHANNETGTVQPVEEIGAICRRHGALFHCDASQSVGKVPVQPATMQADLLSLSGHKFYGPMGVGALIVRRKRPRIVLEPSAHGGGQERGLRSGTVNVPGVVGLGAAAELAHDEMEQERVRLERLSALLVQRLEEQDTGVEPNGCVEHRLPGALNLSFPGVTAEDLQRRMRSVAEFSAASACSTGQVGPSHVLRALDLPPWRGLGAVRLVLGRSTTRDQVERVATRLVEETRSLGADSRRVSAA